MPRKNKTSPVMGTGYYFVPSKKRLLDAFNENCGEMNIGDEDHIKISDNEGDDAREGSGADSGSSMDEAEEVTDVDKDKEKEPESDLAVNMFNNPLAATDTGSRFSADEKSKGIVVTINNNALGSKRKSADVNLSPNPLEKAKNRLQAAARGAGSEKMEGKEGQWGQGGRGAGRGQGRGGRRGGRASLGNEGGRTGSKEPLNVKANHVAHSNPPLPRHSGEGVDKAAPVKVLKVSSNTSSQVSLNSSNSISSSAEAARQPSQSQ